MTKGRRVCTPMHDSEDMTRDGKEDIVNGRDGTTKNDSQDMTNDRRYGMTKNGSRDRNENTDGEVLHGKSDNALDSINRNEKYSTQQMPKRIR